MSKNILTRRIKTGLGSRDPSHNRYSKCISPVSPSVDNRLKPFAAMRDMGKYILVACFESFNRWSWD
jgi:hypothetical protein